MSLKLIFILIFILLAGRLCWITEPFGVSVDESTYMAIAEVLQSSGTLYVNAVDRKPPGLFWIYQLIGEVFGPWNIHAVHGVFLGFFLGLCLLAYGVVRRLNADRRIARDAAILFAIFSACFPREIVSCNAEVLMSGALGLGFLFFPVAEEQKTLRWIARGLLVGFFGGVAVLFKQYAVLILLGAGVGYCMASRGRREIVRRAVFGLFVLAGGLAVFGFCVWWFDRQGARAEFFKYFLFSGLQYVAESRSLQQRSQGFWLATAGMLLAWAPLWLSAFRAMRRRVWGDHTPLLIGMSVGALLTIYLSGRYYTHYFLPLVWTLSLLAAGVWGKGRWAQSLITAVIFGGFGVLNVFRDELGVQSAFSKVAQQSLVDVAEEIQKLTLPSDRIVVWGMASQIYPLSERGSGTRFIFADFVSGRQPGFASEISRPQAHAEAEFLDDLYRGQPKLIVDTSGAKLNDYGAFPLERFSRIKDRIDRHYFLVSRVHGFDLWMLSPH